MQDHALPLLEVLGFRVQTVLKISVRFFHAMLSGNLWWGWQDLNLRFRGFLARRFAPKPRGLSGRIEAIVL